MGVESNEESLAVDHAADADLRGPSGDRVIHLPDLQKLEHPEPVPDVPEHEAQVVVVLERLKLHARNVFERVGFDLAFEQACHLGLGEPGELHVVAGALQVTEHFRQGVLVEFRQFAQAVVGDEVGQFLRVARVLLPVDGHLVEAQEQ